MTSRRKFLGLVAATGLAAGGMFALDWRRSLPASSGADRTAASGEDAGPRRPDGSAAPPDEGGTAPVLKGAGTLIVFFSHRGANYPDLDLKVGNTQQIAGFIRDRIGGDIYEVEPAVPYPADYDRMNDMAEAEEEQHTYRAIRPGAPDTSGYRTVFLGYPIWWGEQPMALQTFMRDHDLSSATIVPFCTHEGSQFGNSLEVIAKRYPGATVRDGFARQGQDVHDSPDEARAAVDDWLKGLGF